MMTLVGEVVRRALSVVIAPDYCKMRANFERVIKSLNENKPWRTSSLDDPYRIVGAGAVANINAIQRYEF